MKGNNQSFELSGIKRKIFSLLDAIIIYFCKFAISMLTMITSCLCICLYLFASLKILKPDSAENAVTKFGIYNIRYKIL
uniref:RDD family protein n=1 Tax=Ascaris lumbricoides TaxID=6252 RepID=A0A0M3HP53_ASCLU